MLWDGLIEPDLIGRKTSGEHQSFPRLPLPHSDCLLRLLVFLILLYFEQFWIVSRMLWMSCCREWILLISAVSHVFMTWLDMNSKLFFFFFLLSSKVSLVQIFHLWVRGFESASGMCSQESARPVGRQNLGISFLTLSLLKFPLSPVTVVNLDSWFPRPKKSWFFYHAWCFVYAAEPLQAWREVGNWRAYSV